MSNNSTLYSTLQLSLEPIQMDKLRRMADKHGKTPTALARILLGEAMGELEKARSLGKYLSPKQVRYLP